MTGPGPDFGPTGSRLVLTGYLAQDTSNDVSLAFFQHSHYPIPSIVLHRLSCVVQCCLCCVRRHVCVGCVCCLCPHLIIAVVILPCVLVVMVVSVSVSDMPVFAM